MLLRSAQLPTATRSMLSITRDEVAAVAERHRLLDVREELELVLDVFRREQRAVVELADVLGAVDDLEMPVLASKKPASPVCT